MKRFIFIFCIFVLAECQEDEREAKFFFGPKVETAYAYRKVPKLVTEFVPSSCIVVEPTLPPCRHVRKLEISPSSSASIYRITQTRAPQPAQAQNWQPQPSESVHHAPTPPLRLPPQQVKYTSPSWNWNLFNIFRVQNYTRTVVKTEYITTKVPDPNTVVSFYVRGCRPSNLPFNLPECARAEEAKPEKNFVVMAPLKFVPDSLISPSKSDKGAPNEEDEAEEEQVTEKIRSPDNI